MPVYHSLSDSSDTPALSWGPLPFANWISAATTGFDWLHPLDWWVLFWRVLHGSTDSTSLEYLINSHLFPSIIPSGYLIHLWNMAHRKCSQVWKYTKNTFKKKSMGISSVFSITIGENKSISWFLVQRGSIRLPFSYTHHLHKNGITLLCLWP